MEEEKVVFSLERILSALFVVICAIYLYFTTRRPGQFPPGPPIYPYFGNTRQLRKEARELGGQHLVFEKWSKNYNSPILGLRLGSDNIIVVLGYKNVREIHLREEFDGRPDNFFLRLRCMGSRRGVTCVDGNLWSEQRSFVSKHLREAGYGRNVMDLEIENELTDLVKYLDSLGGKTPVWPGQIFSPNVLNVLWVFTAGYRIPRDDKRLTKILELLRERSKAFDMSGGILTQLPWIRFIAPDWSGFNLIRKFNQELKAFFMEIINDHHKNFNEEKVHDDLIYAFINEMRHEAENPHTNFTDLQLTMIILDIFIAGGQTTSTTLDLAFMMLILRPDLEEKLFDEISKLSNPAFKDRLQMPYTEAYLMEVQRFFHIVPLSGPRRVLKDTTLGGYSIPKNTTVLIGLRSVHMDSEFWGDPEVFRPERFLNETGEKIVNSERLMSFGQGKRRCLGEALARSCLFTFFVGVLKQFKVELPENTEEKPNIKLQPGITLSPKPYNVIFKRRNVEKLIN